MYQQALQMAFWLQPVQLVLSFACAIKSTHVLMLTLPVNVRRYCLRNVPSRYTQLNVD